MTTTTPAHDGLRPRLWLALVLLGLVGQLAWTVENMYLNVFVYETISDDPQVVAALVAASAVTATVATLVMGALSDRLGRRRVLIVGGYLLWGASTAAFGLLPQTATATTAGLATQSVTAAVLAVVVLDCIMTFFGSTANDAAYQAWVTDVTTPSVRGRVDAVLAAMPLLAMLLVFVLLDPLTQAGEWRTFFGVVGAAVTVTGLVALWLVRDTATPQTSTPYLRALVAGLRPSAVRGNPLLYLTLLVWCVWGASTQVFLPYLLIYMDHSLRLDAYAIVLGGVLLTASVLSVLGGRVVDRVGKVHSLLPATLVYLVGLLAMVPARSALAAGVAGAVMMTGFMLTAGVLTAVSRDLTPDGAAGRVQGLRMIFAILVPMLVGPWIGAAVIRGNDARYTDLGVERVVPTSAIFAAAAAVLVVAIVLAIVLRARLLARPTQVGAPTAPGAEAAAPHDDAPAATAPATTLPDPTEDPSR
ncbi:MFS transporter [Sanguibacter sp. HDW7]|uniref:MFS transporter n=1 Tax=Sanguibacter sp. HDW7 TaxID=2714931 RepID=UPI00140C0E31|nr:MFS transporter [Sanguibacter sp. HDW7]QIK82371.1 MFS transporter [Sanguibacter sp. HDW7]